MDSVDIGALFTHQYTPNLEPESEKKLNSSHKFHTGWGVTAALPDAKIVTENHRSANMASMRPDAD
jgi:hypothetical protein